MAMLEGRWDCSQCETKRIRGGLLKCPTCGDPRNAFLDPEEATYLPEDARIVTDEAELARANSGPAWYCGFCGEANWGDDSECSNPDCQRPRDSDDSVFPIYKHVTGVDAEGVQLSDPEQADDDRVDAILKSADKLQALEDGPVTMPSRNFLGNAPTDSDDSTDEDDDVTDAEEEDPKARKRIPRIALFVPLVVLLVVGLVAGGRAIYDNFIATHPVDLTVTGLKWERALEVEEFRTLTLEDWDVPADGRVISSRREIRSYRDVFDHYETRTRQVAERRQTGTRQEPYECGSTTVDKGNGYYERKVTYCYKTVPVYETVYRTETWQEPVYRKEPVYDTMYTYQVDRWVTDHFDTASGTTNPYWPETTAKGDKQRIGDERREAYLVTLRDPEGRSFDRKIDEATWSKVRVGMTVVGDQTRQGDLREVHWQ